MGRAGTDKRASVDFGFYSRLTTGHACKAKLFPLFPYWYIDMGTYRYLNTFRFTVKCKGQDIQSPLSIATPNCGIHSHIERWCAITLILHKCWEPNLPLFPILIWISRTGLLSSLSCFSGAVELCFMLFVWWHISVVQVRYCPWRYGSVHMITYLQLTLHELN